jgi:hypothetical protein
MLRTFADFRVLGRVIPIRHPDIHIWHQDRDLLRTLATDALGEVSVMSGRRVAPPSAGGAIRAEAAAATMEH